MNHRFCQAQIESISSNHPNGKMSVGLSKPTLNTFIRKTRSARSSVMLQPSLSIRDTESILIIRLALIFQLLRTSLDSPDMRRVGNIDDDVLVDGIEGIIDHLKLDDGFVITHQKQNYQLECRFVETR